jgi:hypothetical protein
MSYDDPEPSDAIALFGSVPADAGIAADSQHQVRGVPGQVDDLVFRRSGHGRARDRSRLAAPLHLLLRPSGRSSSFQRSAAPLRTDRCIAADRRLLAIRVDGKS